jgi:hypothetical protein
MTGLEFFFSSPPSWPNSLQLNNHFISDTQAEGSYAITDPTQSTTVTSSETSCVSVKGKLQCSTSTTQSQTSCDTSGSGTWTATPSCVATVGSSAKLLGPRLAIVLDQSTSMGDAANLGMNASARWIPVRDALLDFVAEPGSQLQASLHLFPASTDGPAACQNDYSIPQVAMIALPAQDSFAKVLSTTTTGGGAPTLSAVIGAGKYLRQLQSAAEPIGSAIVLITDGEPSVFDTNTKAVIANCAPAGMTNLQNSIPSVVQVAAASYQGCPSIPVYVVGISDAAASLGPIAKASGGPFFFFEELKDPAATRANIANILRSIAAGL